MNKEQGTATQNSLNHAIDLAEENARLAKVTANLWAETAARELAQHGAVRPETFAAVEATQARAATWRAIADATYAELHNANQEAGL